MTKHSFFIGLQVFLLATSGFTYQVKQGDTLSSIARRQGSLPLYGANGSLSKILKLNPAIKNPDLIFPDQVLILNDDLVVKTDSNILRPNQDQQTNRAPASESNNPDEEKSQSANKVPVAKLASPHTDSDDVSLCHVGINLESRYLRLDGRDDSNGGATATFLSEISPGVSLFWSQAFSDKWSGKLLLNVYSLQMQKFAKRSFTNDKVSLSSLSYDVRYKYDDSDLVFDLKTGFGQQVFVQSVDAQTLQVLRILTPEVSLGLEWSFFKAGPFSGSLLGGVGWVGSGHHSEFSANAGQLYYGGVTLNQKLRSGEIHAELKESRSRQSSDLLGTMDRTQLLFELGYSWDLK